MYEVQVESEFYASHAVMMPSGELEPVHWHRWRVQADYEGPTLDSHGLLVDFVTVQAEIRQILDPLEGAHLNDHPFLENRWPSTEEIARRIFECLACRPHEPARLRSITVHEAPGCSARYRSDKY